MTNADAPTWNCPIPAPGASGDVITLAHGEGGLQTQRLIQQLVLPILGNDCLRRMEDAARLTTTSSHLAFTTDGFVVSPLLFPGGDIGKLAVFGTTNDLIVAGARPRWLSLSLIIEEGLPIELLRCVLHSVVAAAKSINVEIVAGDTKVVPRGAADQLFINTSSLGELIEPTPPGAAALKLGDELLVTGNVGQHGVAILACRENLGFEPPPQSDCASLWDAAQALREADIPIRAMRDATRGGAGSVLHEWASACGHTLTIESSTLPVSPDARGICELLGLDPLFLANEGMMLVAVPAGYSQKALAALHEREPYRSACRIGKVISRRVSPVLVRSTLAQERPLDAPTGQALPRIC